MGFGPRKEVLVGALDERNWELLEGLDYRGKTEPFEVPKAMHTDFASVPRVFVWFLPTYGRYTKAAILHDHLWRDLVPAGRLSRLQADGIFRRAMRELEVPFLRRWIMWAAVRWAALIKPGGWKGWWKESWRVLLVSLLALPIVAIPAAAIVVALVAFFLVEVLFWVPLKLVSLVKGRTAKGSSPKRVNAPAFHWRTS